jgi:hypothetical protein
MRPAGAWLGQGSLPQGPPLGLKGGASGASLGPIWAYFRAYLGLKGASPGPAGGPLLTHLSRFRPFLGVCRDPQRPREPLYPAISAYTALVYSRIEPWRPPRGLQGLRGGVAPGRPWPMDHQTSIKGVVGGVSGCVQIGIAVHGGRCRSTRVPHQVGSCAKMASG